MDMQEYLDGCLEEAALVVSDGSRPLRAEDSQSIARALLADAHLTFKQDEWNPASPAGVAYVARAIERAAVETGRPLQFADAKGIADHLLWYELDLSVTYRP